MSKSITQDVAYRQSLMKYAEKYGVSRASRKYNKSRSYIYFWRARWDGSVESLACQSRRPHSHPNQHTAHPGHNAVLNQSVEPPADAKGGENSVKKMGDDFAEEHIIAQSVPNVPTPTPPSAMEVPMATV